MRDLKGLGYLQHLLRYPNQEFHCLELLGGKATNDAEGRQEDNGSAVSRGDSTSAHHAADSGPMVDDQARAAYKRELIRLKEKQEDRLERKDAEGADRIQSEIDAIAHELGRAIGLGGRVRRMGSTSERARLNVGSAIRTALAKILEHDSQLGVILGRDIRTGTFCEYVPAASDPIAWQFSTSEQTVHPEITPPYVGGELIKAGRVNWVLDGTPFVGRDPQRSILMRNLELARSGSGRVVTLGGEAGVGKTRLSREFCSIASRAGFLAMAGACDDAEDAVPFIPFVEILESALTQSSSPDAFREAVGPDGAELLRLMPSLAARIPGIARPQEVSSQQSRRLLFNSVAAVVARASTRQPLLLLIEDLHWADEGSLALLVHVARAVANLPVMIVVNHRDERGSGAELTERALYELSRLPNAEHIKLSGLPDTEVAALLQALSEKVPPRSLVEAMSSATEGNPLFVRELYEHLSGVAKLFGPDGDFRRDLTLEEIGVPEGVRRLLARRVSLLAPETRRVLLYAATIGKSFAFDLLVLSVGGEEEALLDHLEKAEQIGLLDSVLESREARFYFSHELVRQVILEEASAARAQRFHLKVADAIEKLYAGALDDYASDLAYHLTRAGNLADADRSIRYLMMAAQRELAQSACASAVRHTSHALELFSSQPESKRSPQQELWLQLLHGNAVAAVKGWAAPEAGLAYERSQALCAALGDAPQLFQVLAALCGFHVVRAEFHSALSLARRVAQMADRLDDDSIRIASLWFQGCSLFFLGNLVEAREELERGVALHSKLGGGNQAPLMVAEDPATACLTYSALAGWCLGKADWRDRQQEAIERARNLQNPFTTVWTMTNLSIAHLARHEWVELEMFVDEGQKLADKCGFDLWSVSLDLYRHEAMAARGQAQSIEKARRMLAQCKAMGVQMLVPLAHTIIAELLGQVGQIEEAHAELDAAFTDMNVTQERHYEAETHRVRGELHLKERQGKEAAAWAALGRKAEQCFLTGCATAEKQGVFAYEVRSALSLARLWMTESRPHEAQKLLERICSHGSDWNSPELERAKTLIGDLSNSSQP